MNFVMMSRCLSKTCFHLCGIGLPLLVHCYSVVRWGIVPGMASRHPTLTGGRGETRGACKAELGVWHGTQSIPAHFLSLVCCSTISPTWSRRNGWDAQQIKFRSSRHQRHITETCQEKCWKKVAYSTNFFNPFIVQKMDV